VTASSLTVGAMVVIPFLPRGGLGRRLLSSVVVSGLFSATTSAASRRWTPIRALGAAGATATMTAAIERVGITNGRPFGRYRYTGALQPQIAGVPVLVPMAWFAMAVPARETAHAALGRRSNRATRVVAGAAALTAWDLFLDPQMVGEGYWLWARRGAYRGIPISNYLGWFVTGLGVMAVLEVLLPPGEAASDLVAEYGVMAAMETVGFATFFGDRVVAAVGGVGMLPIAVAAVARLVGQRT
jgi:uncharacterized membrane protein